MCKVQEEEYRDLMMKTKCPALALVDQMIQRFSAFSSLVLFCPSNVPLAFGRRRPNSSLAPGSLLKWKVLVELESRDLALMNEPKSRQLDFLEWEVIEMMTMMTPRESPRQVLSSHGEDPLEIRQKKMILRYRSRSSMTQRESEIPVCRLLL